MQTKGKESTNEPSARCAVRHPAPTRAPDRASLHQAASLEGIQRNQRNRVTERRTGVRVPQKAEKPHGKERRGRGTGGCATRGLLQRVETALLFEAKQEGRRTGWSKRVDGEERGRTGGSASSWFCSRKSYRGTTRVVEVFSLPTAVVGSPLSLFGSSVSEKSVGSPSSSLDR